MSTSVDPITYEVVKHRLWQITDEQGTTIRTISTSPIVVEGNDFNVGLFTRDGDVVVAGPYVLTHVTTLDTVIKHVLREAEGIEDGDVFLVNDPYRGALHQNDVALVAPFFHEGEILLWIGNVLHHADLAGIDEGSFCINATSVFQEAPRYFLRLVHGGRLLADVERTFVMNSRLPDIVGLDLRAQLGALNVAGRRLRELVAERGTGAVTEVMERSVDDAEHQLRARITELPDGAWETDVYMDVDRVGSERLLTVHVRLEKAGDELWFDYTGTSEQSEGAVNATGYACYAGTAMPVYTFLCDGEIDWNAGLTRCVHVHAPEGTVMNARFPAPVSICSIGFTWLAAVAAMRVVAWMLSESEAYRDRACPSWAVSCNANNLFGVNRAGKVVGALLSDHRSGGAAARSFADGFDHAGQIFSAFSFLSNVESQEWKLPVLYVHRRQLVDSGGPGRYRGGLTAAAALVPYKTDRLTWKSQNTAGSDQSNAAGMHGGYPGAGSQVSVVRDSRVWERLARSEIPLDLGGLCGTVEHLPTKSEGVLGGDDVLVFYPPGGGGFGDPLDREPDAVATDVRERRVSAESAEARYGVLLSPELEVRREETHRRRAELRATRWIGAGPPVEVGQPGRRSATRCLGDVLQVSDGAVRCTRCGHDLGGVDGDPRDRAVRRTVPLAEAGPWLALGSNGDSERFALVQSICPGCGVLLDVEERLR